MDEVIIMEYISVAEAAKKWDLTKRRVQVLCNENRIQDVKKIGNVWAIPVDAKRPDDKRVTTGEYRNWRKKDEKSV